MSMLCRVAFRIIALPKLLDLKIINISEYFEERACLVRAFRSLQSYVTP